MDYIGIYVQNGLLDNIGNQENHRSRKKKDVLEVVFVVQVLSKVLIIRIITEEEDDFVIQVDDVEVLYVQAIFEENFVVSLQAVIILGDYLVQGMDVNDYILNCKESKVPVGIQEVQTIDVVVVHVRKAGNNDVIVEEA